MAGLLGATYLVGTWQFFIAVAGTVEPDLDAVLPGAWANMGLTRGDQSFQWSGSLTGLTDNDTIGMRRFIRPEDSFTITASLAQLTLENIANVTGLGAAAVTDGTSAVVSVKELSIARNFAPMEFALVARGGVLATKSPYGTAFPAQLWIPCGVFDGEPELAFNKDDSPSMEFVYTAEVDDTQPTGEEFGKWIAQDE